MPIRGTRYVSYRTVQIAISLLTFLEYLCDDFALTRVVWYSITYLLCSVLIGAK